MKKITILLPILLILTMLQGCSGGGGSGSSATPQSTVRLLNATTNYPSLDLISSGASIASIASAVASSNVSTYATINSGSNTFTLESAGSGTPSVQATYTLSSNVAYTMVAYTSGQQMQVMPILDNEVAPASGNGKIRVLNLSPDAGSVDFYLTGAGSALSAASVLAKNVMGTSGYSEVAKGTYHLGITGTGNITDVRLDIPSIVISDQQILTLVLTSTVGGVLVDGLFVNQQGSVSSQKNGSARIRVAANIAANGSVAATVNGVSLGSTLRSPVLGSYTLVPAGALTMSVLVNGNPVNAGNLNATAGADLTLLSVGNSTTPQFFLLNDDNRLPNTGMAKVRLLNGINGLNDTISLNADYNQLAYNVAFGTVSDPTSISAGIISRLEVNSLQGNTSLYLANNVSFLSSGVYSVFMLGDNTTPVGFVRRDH